MALTLEHIQIGWISALPIEALLAEIMLDEPIEQAIALPPNDNNIYTYGRIKIAGSHASHIVAIAQLPLSTTGRASAATVANNMRRTFPNLKFGIMVGIAGGVWTTEVDVRLGDIVVGVPDDGGPGIIQYDHGKAIQEREFILKGTLNKAPDLLRSAAGLLQRKHMRKPGEYVSLLDNEEVKRLAPRPDVDNLFSAAYLHHGGKSCEGCDKSQLRDRSHRTDLAPKVHYGAIASGDQVVKDAILAEKIQKRHNIMCFEMEAAGLDAFPCLVIRGISDYADTHKNDDWHAYAAGTAAAYAKELLSVVPLTAVAELPSTGFAEIARLQVPPLENTTPGDVTRWLATTKESWLLILDNCDDPELDFSNYIPSRGGSTIITTRLVECRIHGKWENIDELGSENAVQLLLKASGLEEGNQRIITPVAESIVSILGQHALALVHAGAYIKKGYCTLSDYVQLFRDEQNQLIEFKPEQQASRYGSVYTTFEVSAKALASSDKHDSHLALKLLNIIAFLDREGIEEDVFTTAFDKCHGLECQWEFVWQENEVQWFRRCAISGNEKDSIIENHTGVENLDSSRSITEVVCSWRGRYQSGAGSKSRSVLLSIPRGREPLQEPTDPTSTQSVLSHIRQDAEVPHRLNDIIIEYASECSDSQVLYTGTNDNKNHMHAYSGITDSEENNEANKNAAAHNKFDDDGEIHHLDIWHCNKVRSSGLVDFQKAMRLRAACIRLADLSLIKFDNNTISMHPLVHEWARTRLDEVVRQNAWEQALSVLALCSAKMGTALATKIMTHIQTCFRIGCEDIVQSRLSLHIVRALYQLAWVHYCHRDFVTSLRIFETLANSYELQPHTLASRSKLLLRAKAMCFGELGKLDKMRSCVDQVVQSTTQWFEWNSWEAFDAQRLLADLYHTAGDSQAAANLLESLYERYSQSNVLGDLVVRSLLHSLIWAHQSLGNSDRAITLLIEELKITKRLCSRYHPYLLNTLSRLSASYITANAAEKAVALLQDVVDPQFKQIPRDYWWVEIMLTLARAYAKTGAYDKAIPVLEEIHSHCSTSLSAKDPLRTAALNQLVEAYLKVGRSIQATTLLEKLVETCASSRIPSDPGRLISMDRLAKAYLDLDKPSQAVPLLEEVVRVEASNHPPNDRRRLISMDRLAHAYLRLNEPNQAVGLLKEVLEVYASALLPHDPGRLISMDRLAKAYLELDKPSEAVPLLEEVIKYLPENDSRRLISMDRLAEAYVRRGKPDSAIALLEDVVENLPTDDPRRLISMDRLANAYLKLDRCEQAVPLLEKLVALRTAHLAEQDISRLMSVRNLARAYTDLENRPRVHEALSLLEEVMDKGRETLHADPDQMKWTRELLVNAQEKLRSTSQRQSLMGINAEKCIPDNTADDTLSNIVYQNIQNPLKRGLASTDLDVNDDGNKQNNDEKRSRPTS
ncbi:purine and uridine phosphorylase [Aureobasidium sp. EXF-12298]|nr:purine and uridine phosphorylase [Aureobasidium sp. EXF-12298]